MSEAAIDVNATQGAHMRDVLSHPFAIGGTVLAVAAAAGIVGALAGLAPGLGAGAGALLLALLVAWVIADQRAAEDFYNAYATSRSLATGGGRGFLPGATDLLRKGLRRYTDRAFAGKLAGRVDGVLAFYTYETEYTDSKGNRHTQYHNFTVALTSVPEAKPFLSEVACQRRAGFRFFDKAEDAFRTRQRVKLESEELDRRYEIFIGQNDDQNRARQLFSPTFIDWLTRGDEDLGWEFEGGMLALNVPGHKSSAEDLDAMAAAAAEITERLSSEALESAPPGTTRSENGFNPGAYISVVEAGKGSASLKRRLWALFTLLCMAAGLAIGFATAGSDDSSDSSGYEYDTKYGIGSPELKDFDFLLLPVIAKKDKGKGVHTDDLYGHGVTQVEVGDWISDAFVRGLIEFDAGNRTFHLTPKGERAAR